MITRAQSENSFPDKKNSIMSCPQRVGPAAAGRISAPSAIIAIVFGEADPPLMQLVLPHSQGWLCSYLPPSAATARNAAEESVRLSYLEGFQQALVLREEVDLA